jgi:hypothetical protein
MPLRAHSTPTLHILRVHLRTHLPAAQLASTATEAQTHPHRPSSEDWIFIVDQNPT